MRENFADAGFLMVAVFNQALRRGTCPVVKLSEVSLYVSVAPGWKPPTCGGE